MDTLPPNISFPPTPDSLEDESKKSLSITSSTHWENVAARRRNEINSKIPQSYIFPSHNIQAWGINATSLSGLLSPREQEIVDRSATSLLEHISKQQYTSVEVAIAYCKSAALAHQLTNCLAWVMFEDAIADAKELDIYIQTHGTPKGPLHGLPISVKEHIYFKDTPSTSGFIAWADDFATEDALIVKLFREAGAVFHVKTTNPQSLMALETMSNLHGTTSNPYNTTLTSGGSSGGESALLAMKGSPLGIGTDIGGSIRVPAAFCGIYGLKPSVGRLPHGGLSGTHAGMENIIGAVGPMGRSVEDLSLFCKVLLDAEPWREEPPLVEIPWRGPQSLPKRLRIGVMYHDGLVIPHPPVTRTLRETAKSLEAAGHEIVTWDPTLHRELIDTLNQLYFLDGGQEYWDVLAAGKEPPVPLIKWILEKPIVKNTSVSDSWKLNHRRTALQTLYAAQWNAANIDVLLCPANASVASAHEESTYWGYSSVFNVLDYSGVTFPASFVQKSDTWENFPRATEVILSPEDAVYQNYYGNGAAGPEKYRGAPVPLQLIGRRFTEERLVSILGRVVEDMKTGGIPSVQSRPTSKL